jgi:IS30 family transposase
MDQEEYTTRHQKGKHLNYDERMIIQLRLKDGWKISQIVKELGCAYNTVKNEIQRGTVDLYHNTVKRYKAKAGQEVYDKNRKNSRNTYKWLKCSEFLSYVSNQFHESEKRWSLDACFGRALLEGKFPRTEMVCTKTLYNYVDQKLLPITNMELPEKLKRNNKIHRNLQNKRILGRSIEERPAEAADRNNFGNWEIDTVVGEKSGKNEVLLTLVERMSDNCIFLKIHSKEADDVMKGMNQLKEMFSEQFSHVFKTITSDNGSEFARLSELEESTETRIYYTHPYTSCERPVNERHNGIIRRFLPKGTRLEDFSIDEVGFLEDWINQLPRKVLGYRTPEEVFNEKLDIIYRGCSA